MKPEIQVHFEFFPEAWDKGVPKQVFELLVGPDKMFPAKFMGNEGGEKLPEMLTETHAILLDHYERSPRGIQLFTQKGKADFWFQLNRVEWNAKSLFGSTLFWPKRLTMIVPLAHWLESDWLPVLVQVAKITDAPVVSIDCQTKLQTSPYYRIRNARKRVLQATVHGTAQDGPWRGLGRIGWTRIFGPHIVDMLGVDRLAALPSGRARDLGDQYWQVSTTTDPMASLEVAGTEVDNDLITELGPQFFFDEKNMRMPLVVPDFPSRLIPDDQKLFERYGTRLKPLP